MKKCVKIFSYCFIFMILSLCVGIGEVSGYDVTLDYTGGCYLGKTPSVVCSYANGSDYIAQYKVSYREGQGDLNLCPDIYVEKFGNVSLMNKWHPDKNSNQVRRLTLTSACPQAIGLHRKSGVWDTEAGMSGEVDNFINAQSNGTNKKLTLSDSVAKQIENIKKLNALNATTDVLFRVCYGYCLTAEVSYNCDYISSSDQSKKWSIKLSESYHEDIGKEEAYNSASFQNDKGYRCPGIVYKVSQSDNSNNYGYIFFGDYVNSGWPAICNNKGVVCESLNQRGDYEKFDNPANQKTFPLEATYYKFEGLFKELDKQHSVEVDIKVKGSNFTKYSFKKDGEDVGWVAKDIDLNGYINSIKNSQVPQHVGCWSSANLPSEYSLIYDKSKTYSTYCYFYNKDTNDIAPNIGDEIFSLYSETVDNGGLGSINGFNSNFSDFCDTCLADPEDPDCVDFGESLQKAQKFARDCREIYGGLNANDLQKCDLFMSNLVTWSKNGCFGDQIIATENTSRCGLGGLGDWLSKIYTIFKFAVPIIIIAMGIKDFVQSLASNNEDELKKTGSTFLKRLIMGIIFIALPILIEMIITIALGGSFADMCITI